MGKVFKTGRPREEEYWGRVTVLEGGRRVKCNDCGLEFAASANRIKSHIDKVKGQGIRVCTAKSTSNNDMEHNLLGSHGQRIVNEAGQIQADDANEDQERIHVGSSLVLNWENDEHLLVKYVYECLRPEDKVFISPSLHLTKKEFITLKPGTYLDSWVIDIFVEILTECEKKKAKASNWYLPLRFSTAVLGYDERGIEDNFSQRMQNFKKKYIYDQEWPKKVFIPIHVGPNEGGHFYLNIFHLNNNIIEIWDSKPGVVNETNRAEITKKLLFAMEILFEKKRTFSNYQMETAKDILPQPNGFDCGVFVVNYMQQSDNYVKRDSSFQFESKKEREDLAMKLLTNDLNNEKQNLYQRARRHYEQVEKQDGTKRLRVDEVNNRHDDLEKGSSKAYLLPTTDLIGANFQEYTEQIRGWIKDEVSSIGIWGMGGSGKTALATHIYDKLLEEADTKVVWVTVSQNSLSHLQKVLAISIKLDISDELEDKIIARKLFQAFKEMEKRVVIILDDVWDHFSLKEVGFPMSDNRITMLVTTRIRDVCQGMGCKENIIEVKSLDDKDSFALFEKFVELHDGTSLEVKNIARDLSHACQGLPLAIVRIATSMKGKTQVSEWSHMLECLTNLGDEQYEVDKWVVPVLRSSYDFLNNKLQRFFLYCSLSTGGSFYYNNVEHLIRRFAFESIDETKKLFVQYREGHNMLDKLSNHSMLNQYGNRWSIHVFHRFLAISIAEDPSKIMANSYKDLTEIPSDVQWKEGLQTVFLTGNMIGTIPNGTCPGCSQLSTLLLDRNKNLNYMPDDFFNNMPVLKTLNLSYTSIKGLPKSVSSLKCLTTLLLSGCQELSFIPSLIELKRLLVLDLSNTAITEAPTGLEALVKLRCLCLLYANVKMTASILSKLIHLEWLEMKWILEPGCIQCLQKLEVIVAVFSDISVINNSVIFLEINCALRSFDLTLVGAGYDPDHVDATSKQHYIKRITFKGVDLGKEEAILLGDIKELFIKFCNQVTGVRDLCKFLSYEHNNNPHKIELLDIESCDGLEYLCCLSASCPFCSSSQLVGCLDLKFLRDLKYLVSPFAFLSLNESSVFSHLTDLKIWGCDSMQSLMAPKLVELLQNLRTIDVGDCKEMKEIFRDDHFEKELATGGTLSHPLVILPNLTSMELWRMPQLNYIYRGILLCPSLQTFSACDESEQLDSPRIKISSDGCLLPMDKTQFSLRYHWKIEND